MAETLAQGECAPPASGAPPYTPARIERRWQAAWKEAGAFLTPAPEDNDDRQPAYVFAGCPFTSGSAHMGHVRSYTIADAHARFLRARGRAVLFSLGFDSFGLPAELEAIRRGISSREWVLACRQRMREQFEMLGYSCDWERSFLSSEPEHYRWTQWLFLRMLERDLVYRKVAQVNRCDSCETVLAAIQAPDGRCWRCHSEVRLVREPHWFMRISAFVQDNERGLDRLPGWDRLALGAQRAVIGRVDGVELDARTLQEPLTVFTPHADAIDRSGFVAISPAHPLVESWSERPEVARAISDMREVGLRREQREAEFVPVAMTAELAIVPGVERALPIVISPLVDARFGATAVLGIPDCDPTDRVIFERLPPSPRMPLKVSAANAAPRPAVRYRLRDFAISRQRAWGAPIPLVRCAGCGIVPVALADLPVRLPEDLAVGGEGGNPLACRPDFYECDCPRCGGRARRETDTIDCHLDGMWMWMPICVPPQARAGAMFNHPEYARWLPVEQIVWGADAGGYMFDQRVIGKLLQDLGELPVLPDREPFANALMHQMIQLDGRKMSKHLDNAVDPQRLLERHGADAVRLAVLHAAAPRRSFNWNEQPLREAEMFLRRLFAYAEPHLRAWRDANALDADGTDDADEPTVSKPTASKPVAPEFAAAEPAPPDPTDKLRRRLANWCEVATDKITSDLERLELQRAAHNAMLLLTRIQDFERRVVERRGAPSPADREAVTWALLLLLRLLAPLTPHVAEELWHLAGNRSLLSQAQWPTHARGRATAPRGTPQHPRPPSEPASAPTKEASIP